MRGQAAIEGLYGDTASYSSAGKYLGSVHVLDSTGDSFDNSDAPEAVPSNPLQKLSGLIAGHSQIYTQQIRNILS